MLNDDAFCFAEKAGEISRLLHVSTDRAMALLFGLERKYGKKHSTANLIKIAVYDVAFHELGRDYAMVLHGDQNHPVV